MKKNTQSPSKQDIVIVTRKLDLGGTENHLLMTLPALDQSKFNVRIMSLYPGGVLDAAFRKKGIAVISPPAWLPGKSALLWSMARLCGLMRNRKTLFHFFLPEAYAVGGLCGLIMRHPRMLMSRRSLNYYQQKHPRIAKLEHYLHHKMRALLGNSQAVITNLKDEGAQDSQLRLIYNGLDLSRFDNVTAICRADLGIAEDAVVITKVANLIPYKGHKDLIDALRILKTNHANLHLLIVGRDDKYQADLEAYAKDQGVAELMSFLGSRNDVPAILATSDIGTLCSHEEGFSNSIIEGMAAGLPMVVTDVGGNGEAVLDRQTGYVVPAKTPEALAKAFDTLLHDTTLRQQMGAAGAARVRTTFSLDMCAKAYQNIYTAIADNEKLPAAAASSTES